MGRAFLKNHFLLLNLNVKKILGLVIFLVFSYSASAQILRGQAPNEPGAGNRNLNSTGQNTNGFPDSNAPQNQGDLANGKTGRAALDDSTKQVYSPKTLHFYLQDDWMNSRDSLHNIDTSLNFFHRYLQTEQQNFLSTDLGAQGTALRSVFLTANTHLGTQLGYQAYRPYGYDSDSVRYYNTKSPFSVMDYDMGTRGQSRFNFTFNRNVDSLWNVGLELQRLNSKKILIDDLYQSGDRSLINHWSFLFHSNFTSKNKKYRLMTNLNYFNQETREQGGVELLTGFGPSEALKYTDNSALLTAGQTKSTDKDFTAHYYHEFIGWKGLQFYQKIQFLTKNTQFKDLDFVNTLGQGIYPRTYIQYVQAPLVDSLYNKIAWKEFSHQTGIKGIYKGFNYLTYFKQRYWNVQNLVQNVSKNRLENYVGIDLNQKIGNNFLFSANGEYLIGADYLLHGKISTTYGYAEVKRTNVSPSLKDNWTYNSSFRWKNDFRNSTFDELNAAIILPWKSFKFSPSLNLNRIANFIYYDEEATVKQASNSISIIRIGADIQIKKEKFFFWTKGFLNNQFGPDVFRAPKMVLQGTISYDINYKTKLYTRTGIDFHYYSSYYAPAYQMAIQSYHLQNDYLIPAFVQVDPYISLRINYVRLFFKYSNALQGLLTKNHYTSYLYQAMPSGLGMGVVWQLFD